MAKWIRVSLGEHRLMFFEGDSLIKKYPIAVGKASTPTPTGTYKIINKEPNPGGPYGAFWMGLSIPHYGIHGTNDPSSIGKSVSEGCIRMYNNDVVELSKAAPIGTRVDIND